MTLSRSALVSLLTLSTALTLAAVALPARARSLGARWHEMDQSAEQALLAGHATEARRTLDRVIDQMMREMGPGEASKQAMGIVLMHRALAQAELGDRADALWDWAVALNFNSALASEDLSRFGAAGKLLAGHPLRKPGALGSSGSKPSASLSDSDDIEPPKVRHHPRPHFPPGAIERGQQGPIVIQAIISAKGEVTQPLVFQDLGSATLAYSALEAVRQWTFEPARRDGKPVSVLYNLKIYLRLGR